MSGAFLLSFTLSCLECSCTEVTLGWPLLMDCDNSENTVTSYIMNYWGSMPSTGRHFLLHQHIHTNYRAHPTSYPVALCNLSLDIKWLVCENDHWPAFSADIKNKSIFTSTSYCHQTLLSTGTILPSYLYTVWELLICFPHLVPSGIWLTLGFVIRKISLLFNAYWGLFSRGKMASLWGWPLTSI